MCVGLSFLNLHQLLFANEVTWSEMSSTELNIDG